MGWRDGEEGSASAITVCGKEGLPSLLAFNVNTPLPYLLGKEARKTGPPVRASSLHWELELEMCLLLEEWLQREGGPGSGPPREACVG